MDFQQRVAAVDLNQFEGVDVAVGPKDHVVGVLSDYLKRVYCIRASLKKSTEPFSEEIMKLAEGHRFFHFENPEVAHGGLKCKKFVDEMSALADEAFKFREEFEYVNRVFWSCLRLDFPELTMKDTVGIRKDGKVVWTECEDEIPFGFDVVDISELLGGISPGKARAFKES